MIKGVNRQIIEVSETGNTYFERALLFVRANCSDTDSAVLHREAQQVLRRAGSYTGLRLNRRKRRLQALFTALGGSAVGASVGILVMLLIR